MSPWSAGTQGEKKSVGQQVTMGGLRQGWRGGHLEATTLTREKTTRGSSVYSGVRHSSPLLRGKHLWEDE